MNKILELRGKRAKICEDAKKFLHSKRNESGFILFFKITLQKKYCIYYE